MIIAVKLELQLAVRRVRPVVFAYSNKIGLRDSKRAVEQIIGREGETATFIWRCLVSLNLCGGGFAPRQFNRSTLSGEN